MSVQELSVQEPSVQGLSWADRIDADEPRTRRGWHLAPGLLLVAACAVLVLAVLLTGQRPTQAPAGLPDAGPLVAWTVMLARTMMRLGAVGAVGCLVAAAWLLPQEASRSQALPALHRRLLRAAGRWSLVWAVTSVLLMVSGSAQLLGRPLPGALSSSAVWGYVPQLAEGRALMVTAPAVLVITVHAAQLRSRRGMHLLTGVALLALAPMALTGHAATAGNHYVATQSLVLHVLGVTVWMGGLLALLHLRGATGTTQRTALTRFSSLALGCFVVVALSGLVSASTRLGVDVGAWRSTYGALVGAKLVLLVVLGAIGCTHRRHTLPSITAGRRGAFWRLALGELVIMSAALGLAVALARTAPPVRAGVVAAPHPTLRTIERGLQSPTPDRLLLESRPDALVMTVLAVVTLSCVVVYGRATRQDSRARAALLWFLAAVALLLWSLCGGLAAYGSAVLSGHVAQLLVCAVLVPRLLARAACLLTRVQRLHAPDERVAGRVLTSMDPLSAAVLLSVFLCAVYATPVLELTLRSPAAHLAVDLLGVTVGSVGLLGTTLLAAPDPDRRGRVNLLTGLVLAAFGVGLSATVRPLALDWFATLRWDWSDPVTDQRYAAVALFVLALALVAAGALRRRRVPPG
ncbi:MAG: cytochrome-c oxidase [Marmoricola sp.]|nr:cytochrome-c oxidase [Marmoricola sp.]